MTPLVTVIQSPRERLSKCSLKHLRERPDIRFHKAIENFRFDASDYTLLAVDAPPLTIQDAERPLLLLDSTWRLVGGLMRCLEGEPVRRSIPAGVETAYPRVSKIEPDPDGGLASVEALFVARALLGTIDLSLLDGYYWREPFLESLRKSGVIEGL